MTEDSATLPGDVRRWVGEVAGAIVGTTRLAGGNRHQTWAVTVQGPAKGPTELVLRWTTEPSDVGGISPLRREELACRALGGSPVPVPAVLAAAPELGALLVERVPGHVDLSGTAHGDADDLARQLGSHLGTLHRLDATRLELGELGPVRPIEAHVSAAIDHLRDLYRATGRPDELIALALAWCQQHLPRDPSPATLVHGDAGPGNVLVHEGRVTALIDWELAHLGDPHEDLGALALRTTHGSMGRFEVVADAWATARGRPVDPTRLAHQQVMAALNIVVMRHAATETSLDSGVARRLMSATLHRRLLVDGLCSAVGVDFPETPSGVTDDPEQRHLFDVVLHVLRHEILPEVTRPAVSGAIKDTARLVKYLRDSSTGGSAVERFQLDALAPLADRAGNLADTRAAVAAALTDGVLPVEQALPAVAMAELARGSLVRDAMGSLADRRLPRLTTQEAP